jgi:hypothetical protein
MATSGDSDDKEADMGEPPTKKAKQRKRKEKKERKKRHRKHTSRSRSRSRSPSRPRSKSHSADRDSSDWRSGSGDSGSSGEASYDYEDECDCDDDEGDAYRGKYNGDRDTEGITRMSEAVGPREPIPAVHSMTCKDLGEWFQAHYGATLEEATDLQTRLEREELDGRALVRLWLYTTKHSFLLDTFQRIGIKTGHAATLVHLVTTSVRHFCRTC